MLANIKQRIEMKVKSDNIWPSSEVLGYLLVKNADDRSVLFCDDGKICTCILSQSIISKLTAYAEFL